MTPGGFADEAWGAISSSLENSRLIRSTAEPAPWRSMMARHVLNSFE
jgi:hypothetical protein